MKQRCDNVFCEDFPDYGGKGIDYPAKWKTFEGFYADMGEPPKGKKG